MCSYLRIQFCKTSFMQLFYFFIKNKTKILQLPNLGYYYINIIIILLTTSFVQIFLYFYKNKFNDFCTNATTKSTILLFILIILLF